MATNDSANPNPPVVRKASNPTQPPAPDLSPPAPAAPIVPSTRNTDLLDEAQSRARATSEVALVVAGAPAGTQYFCIEAGHPGGPSGRADIFDPSRHFTYAGQGAPICPLCKRQVSAHVVTDNTQLPPSIQATKERLEIAERATTR